MVHRTSSPQTPGIDTSQIEAFLHSQGVGTPTIAGRVIQVVNQMPFECLLQNRKKDRSVAEDFRNLNIQPSRKGSVDVETAPISHLARRRSTAIELGETSMWKLTSRGGHSAMYAGLDSLRKEYRTLYVGGTGNILTNVKDDIHAEDVTEEERESLRTLLRKEHDMVPVFLDHEIATGHYEGYCKQVLWPLLHYIMWAEYVDEGQHWNDYVAANRVFAKTVAEQYQPGDLIWVHDYHLLLVPQMLREMLPQEAPIALFIHTPFPSSELFRCLPRRRDVLQGMLGCNLVAFQTYNYARHFSSNCTRILGYEYTASGIDANGTIVALGTYPIGIDVDKTRYSCNRPGVAPKAKAIRQKYADKYIIVGRDKLDPVKGVLQKLESFEKFLTDYPEWRHKVVLIQVTSPGVVESPRLEQKTAEIVSRINSKFGSLEFSPVSHFHQHIDRDEYYALLKVADIGLFTPVTDGMNTSSLEYIVAQEGKHSPLILSEFTGTARSMSAAAIVNPWDFAGVARAIAECLTMSEEEKLTKYKQLSRFVTSHTAAYWAKSLVKGLIACNAKQNRGPTSPIDATRIQIEYNSANKRLFFLDYDGTLAPICEKPEDAKPSKKMLDTLSRLCQDPCNSVWVVSGREQETLEKWVGHIPNLGLSSEHGCFIRNPRSQKWISMIDQLDMSWKESVREIFEYYTERTPGSFIEEKQCVITWHYRQADKKFGAFQAKECQNHIEQTVLGKQPVETLVNKMNLEVRPIHINKGEVVKRVLAQHPSVDLILCAGDDKTDEDMFNALKRIEAGGISKLRFTITIGPSDKKTLADWQVDTSEEFVDILSALGQK